MLGNREKPLSGSDEQILFRITVIPYYLFTYILEMRRITVFRITDYKLFGQIIAEYSSYSAAD